MTRDQILRALAVAEAGGNYELAARLRAQLLDAELTAREQVVYQNVADALAELARQPGPVGPTGEPGDGGEPGPTGPTGPQGEPGQGDGSRYRTRPAQDMIDEFAGPHDSHFVGWYWTAEQDWFLHVCGAPCVNLQHPTTREAVDAIRAAHPGVADVILSRRLKGSGLHEVESALAGKAFLDRIDAGGHPVYDYMGAL